MANPSWEQNRCSEDRDALERENAQMWADVRLLVEYVRTVDADMLRPMTEPTQSARAAVEPVLGRYSDGVEPES